MTSMHAGLYGVDEQLVVVRERSAQLEGIVGDRRPVIARTQNNLTSRVLSGWQRRLAGCDQWLAYVRKEDSSSDS